MRIISALLFLATSALGAQQLPVRLLSAPDASSKPAFGTVAAVRQLPGGRLLVNDISKRQLWMLDASLQSATLIADSVSGGANAYGPRAGSIVPYFADSTLFIDPADLSMFIIGPAGNIARVAAVPRSQDAGLMGSNLAGTPAIDTHGRLVYRGAAQRIAPQVSSKGEFTFPELPDTSTIVRVDLATRKLDTVGYFKISRTKINMTQNEKGGMMATTEINPMQTLDDWAVLTDGSVAIVRGRDYHIDWVNADGSMTSSPKMAFDWQRLTDDDKVAVLDSVKTAMERARKSIVSGGGANPGALDGGGGQRTMVTVFGVGSVAGGGGGGGVKAGGDASSMPAPTFVNASELPDYRPPFTAGAAKADLDDNLWIRTSAVRTGAIAGPIYDIVNRQGAVVDRVQVPSGRTIVGFGPGGVVYMLARDDNGSWLERTHR